MSCPRCGERLTEGYGRVQQPMPFSSPERLAKKGRLTMKRRIYVCARCSKTFIRTLALMEVEVLAE